MSRWLPNSPSSSAVALANTNSRGDPGPSSLSSILSSPSGSASAPGASMKRKRSTSRDDRSVHSAKRESVTPTRPHLHFPTREASEVDELVSDGGESEKQRTASGWTYELEIIQQPQRARACGFGDKDRRPLSPPPIIRLWVRTSSGELVDPNHVGVEFLVLMVDLWSADGQNRRNVVMHPSSTGASSRGDSPLRAPSDQRPHSATHLDARASDWPGGNYRIGLNSAYPSAYSPGQSPLSRPEVEIPLALPIPAAGGGAWPPRSPTRPSTVRGTSFNKTSPTRREAPRPLTAPSWTSRANIIPPRPSTGPAAAASASSTSRNFTLPPIASITLQEEGPHRLTLPAMQEFRPPTRDTNTSSSSISMVPTDYSFGRPSSSSSSAAWYRSSSSSEPRHKDSVSSMASDMQVRTPTREAGPPFATWERPSTSGHVTFDLSHPSNRESGSDILGINQVRRKSMDHQHYHESSGGGGRPLTPRLESLSRLALESQTHTQSSPLSAGPVAANYSRVLVGALCGSCQRLNDQNGQLGLFFFAHDLGVRTEGTFTLKFSLTDLASLMRAKVMPGASAPVLAETFSSEFTVYSAKRFPKVIPTTDLTRLFAKQGVRLPTRQKRTAAGESGDEGDGDGDGDAGEDD